MELRHLRYFVVVAEELHFRRAAERLHMSQPPLSQQIRALEEEVGATLLLRNQRRVELTAAGVVFLERARQILAAVEDAARQARRVQRGEVGRLAVGFVGSAMYSFVPDLLRRFGEHVAGRDAAPARDGHDGAAAPARGRAAGRRLPARRALAPGAEDRDRGRGAGDRGAARPAPARGEAAADARRPRGPAADPAHDRGRARPAVRAAAGDRPPRRRGHDRAGGARRCRP